MSYLERSELVSKLEELRYRGIVGNWWAVHHLPEGPGLKAHWHVRIDPPISRAVDWSSVQEYLQHHYAGESAPRGTVALRGAVNDRPSDALLYAAHNSSYLAAKGLVRSQRDIPLEEFVTSSESWFRECWAEALEFLQSLEPKKLSLLEISSLIEENPSMSSLDLLRLVITAERSKSDYELLRVFQSELRNTLDSQSAV
ncbi:MAG: hypothetical protein QXT77_06665 [Candidatus Methanomethylicaceae archaeon]